jgi:hypothetical protein
MPSSYSPLLGIELIQTGEQSGNWGNTTNNNLGTLLEQAIAKLSNVTVSGTSYTLVNTPDGAAYESRSMALNIQGVLSDTCDVICPSKTKLYVVRNSTTATLGPQSIVFKTSAGSGITIANGATAIVFCDGVDVIDPFTTKVNKAGDTMTGGLTFDGGATRIRGDFSSVTLSTRTAFQDKTLNANTSIFALPNGSGTTSDWNAWNSSNPSNGGYVGIGITSSDARLYTSNTGAASVLPLSIVVGGSVRIAINTNGSFNFYNSSGVRTAALDASGNLTVRGNVTAYDTTL